MLASLQQVFPVTARVNNRGHLEIGGCDAVELAEAFGTPLYVFDEETLRRRSRAFVEAFRARYPYTRVLYACKAYIDAALIQILKEEGLGLDVASGGELAVARRAHFPSQLIYFHGNNKSQQELEEAVKYRIGRIVVDGFYELELLQEVVHRLGGTQEVMLRLSPDVDPHTHAHTTTGVLDSKFGFPIATGDAKRAVAGALASSNLRLVGLHFHLGSPVAELKPYERALEIVVEFASQMKGFSLEEISPGGGFAIAYTREQQPPNIGQYAQAIAESLKTACSRRGLPLPMLTIEPGRAIVGPAAVALYKVGATKDIPGVRRYVAVDGGMGDNIRPALYGARYEAVVASRMGEEPQEKVTIVGKYCESGDVLVRDVVLPRLTAGDLVALPASGAYNLAMSSQYNLNPRPAVVLVKAGSARLIRRRESYDELMRLDVE
ncbi:MAG: diaminopimelate decarboxylase [Chloroflexi bacterium]|nr:diaminopimelate decarboxylase [Chloroflexota bacterium]